MPRLVNHADRKKRLVEAVWSLAVRNGLEGVTLRKVAAEAGVSMGQVQHYYPSMSDLVQDAMRRSVLELNAKIEASIAAIDTAGAEDMLRQCLYAMVRLDEESVRLIRFSLAVVGRAMSDSTMAQVLAPADDQLRDFTAGLITAARVERGVEREADAHIDADICWAVAVSLGVDIALGHRGAESALAVLTYHIDQLLAAR